MRRLRTMWAGFTITSSSTPLSLSDCLQGLQLLLLHTMTNTDENENY